MKTLRTFDSTCAWASGETAQELTAAFCNQRVSASSWLPAVSLVAGLTFWAGLQEARAASPEPTPEPFKLTNIHFETNGSACDMGIQMLFDTDGITEGSVEDPNDQVVYSFQASAGMADIGGQTEGSWKAWSRRSQNCWRWRTSAASVQTKRRRSRSKISSQPGRPGSTCSRVGAGA